MRWSPLPATTDPQVTSIGNVSASSTVTNAWTPFRFERPVDQPEIVEQTGAFVVGHRNAARMSSISSTGAVIIRV